ARMLEAFPFVPLGGHVRIGIAIFSYDGGINFGVTGDLDTAPDINVLSANGSRLAGEKRMQAQSGSDGDTDAGRGQEAQQRADQVVPGEPLVRECGEAGDRFGGDHDGRGVGGAGEDEPVQERSLEPAW
ncbi:MAG TPA: WS/DGAT domain-containing protein, partial [Solirubrobacteraceae bacterium]|nr:WS/DGAT domain-containing protein [Solirubrobacteraceae bacterium]